MLTWNFYKPIWTSLAKFQNGHSGQDYNGDQYKGLILLQCGSSLCHLQFPNQSVCLTINLELLVLRILIYL